VEYADGRLFVLEIFLPTIKKNIEGFDDYDGNGMRDSQEKGTRNNTVGSGSIDGI